MSNDRSGLSLTRGPTQRWDVIHTNLKMKVKKMQRRKALVFATRCLSKTIDIDQGLQSTRGYGHTNSRQYIRKGGGREAIMQYIEKDGHGVQASFLAPR